MMNENWYSKPKQTIYNSIIAEKYLLFERLWYGVVFCGPISYDKIIASR